MTSEMRIVAVLASTLLISVPAFAQGSAGSDGLLEPRFLIDIPTAGMLDRGSLALDVDFYQEGGVLFGLSVGIFDRLSLGLSYGGSRLIGAQPAVMDDIPGVNLKVRIIEESVLLPAIAIGFDNQGKDGYVSSLSRYVIKSPGAYASASKNYAMLGYLSIHGGVNYSFERADGDKDANIFVGIEKTLGPFLSTMAEYNSGMNDNNAGALGKGRGYFNAALKWSVGGGLTLGVNFKDILDNGRYGPGTLAIANRTVTLEYVRFF